MSEPLVSEPAAPPSLAPRLHPLLRSGLFTLAFFCVYIAGAMAVYLGVWALGESGLSSTLEVRTELLLVGFAIAGLLLYPITRFFLHAFDRRDFASIGFRWPVGGHPGIDGRRRALHQAVGVPLATLAFLGLWILAVALLGSFEIVGPSSEVTQGIPGWGKIPAAVMLPLVLLGFLVQGGVEEWVTRGYVLRALRERYGFPASAALSSLVFASLHGANPSASYLAMANTFLAGILLAALVERSGSLWSATLCHGFWNFGMGTLASLPVSGATVFKLFEVKMSGPQLVTGGGYGPEGSLVITLLVLPVIAWLWPRGGSVENSGSGSASSRTA